jgi:Mn2+/Fe2+ NRAMP family transporter
MKLSGHHECMAAVARPPKTTLPPVRLGSGACSGVHGVGVNGGIAPARRLGDTLDTALGATGPATVGVVMVALGLVALLALAMKRVSRTETSHGDHRFNACAAQAVRA